MKKLISILLPWLALTASGQPAEQRIAKAWGEFERDDQLRYAGSSLYVVDAKTGHIVFDRQSKTGMVPASTQKIVTSISAMALLGADYRYKTRFVGRGDTLFVLGSGDPTLGSDRYISTKESTVFRQVISGLRNAGMQRFNILVVRSGIEERLPPSGWIAEDIGNYYGAAAQVFNWKENQYDLVLIPGKKTGEAAVIDTLKTPRWKDFVNHCLTGPSGSGDKAYIWFIPGSHKKLIRGTVPAGVNRFTISGADPSPAESFSFAFLTQSHATGFFDGRPDEVILHSLPADDNREMVNGSSYTHQSPSLDSIIYWFNRKSINLYGEALVKTIAFEKSGSRSTDSGISVIQDFWKRKGIEPSELNLQDGSGLSPQNRITTRAQVEMLRFARTQSWFPQFLESFPTYNGMKMKSGTIRDVKAFCGYHRAGNGAEYIFSFIVNNYHGPSSSLVNKMYRVLDTLK